VTAINKHLLSENRVFPVESAACSDPVGVIYLPALQAMLPFAVLRSGPTYFFVGISMSQAGTPALRNGDRFKVRIFISVGTVLAQLAGRSPNAKWSSFAPP
jgi:hypothetical protein